MSKQEEGKTDRRVSTVASMGFQRACADRQIGGQSPFGSALLLRAL